MPLRLRYGKVCTGAFIEIWRLPERGCLRKERAYQATAYNLLGQTFGELRVIGRSRKRTEMGAYWTCLCSCGYTCEATAAELVSGRKTHCGCKSVRSYATSNITGRRFGRLTAMYPTKKRDAKGFVILALPL